MRSKTVGVKKLLLCASISAATCAASVFADDRLTLRNLASTPVTIDAQKLMTPLMAEGVSAKVGFTLDPALAGATGRQQIIVRLSSGSTAEVPEESISSPVEQKYIVDDEQMSLVSRIKAADSSVTEIGRVQHVLNAVFLDVPAELLNTIAADPVVSRVAPVGHYELELAETVPHIGATALHERRLKGKGVKVAVLDSGIDYTHADLGGSGDINDYLNNDGDIIEPGTFPTKKVVGGYDFLGSEWPVGPGGFGDAPKPDPDPFDDFFAGHGTHVADIIAGKNGVAPRADLYALKVCASQSSSCNGISMMLAMDWAVDPNGDGDTSDRVDIINMSLGSGYSQPFDDDLSDAVDNATAIGVLTVASAGNCGDRPYCTGTPAAAPTALSVAQTTVPSEKAYYMQVLEPAAQAGLYEAVHYPWTPEPVDPVIGSVQYGDLDGTNLDGCLPFTGDLSGLVVAVDRGGCFFSDKVRNIEQAGGIAGVVMLVAPGAPFAGAFGGGDPITIPGFNIGFLDGEVLRAGGAVVEFSNELTVSLVNQTVSSTARGPDMSFNAIKPEIGAPGASVSASVGTGTERTAFGGTSGASPMVAGAAALIQDACRRHKKHKGFKWKRGKFKKHWHKNPGCQPHVIKSLLVNNGFRGIVSDTTNGLAEISRIGGGEVRVDQAIDSDLLAFTEDDNQPTLSMGVIKADTATSITKTVRVKNLSRWFKLVQVEPGFRYEADASTGAVSISSSEDYIWLAPYRSKTVTVTFDIEPALLSGNNMNSGADGANPAALTANEFDGYVVLRDGFNDDEIALPWHMIPIQSANVLADTYDIIPDSFPQTIGLVNNGAGVAQNDVYSIIALSDEVPAGGKGTQSPTPDIKAVGVSTVLVDPSFCTSGFLWQFAINTWKDQRHLVPVSHQIILDIDRDGVEDFILLNRDVSFNNISDGRQLSWVLDAATGSAGAFFFAEHATNTGNTVLRACGEQLGLTDADILTTNVDVSVFAQDFYFGGPSDFIEGITVTPLGERFFAIPGGDIPGAETGFVDVYDFGIFPGNTDEAGVMVITNGDRGPGAHGGATKETEAVLLLSPTATPPAPLP